MVHFDINSTFVSMIKQLFCENIQDPIKNPLRMEHDRLLGYNDDKFIKSLNLDFVSPKLLEVTLLIMIDIVKESQAVLSNSSKIKYKQLMDSINDLHEYDKSVIETMIGFFDGSIEYEYGTIEELVLKELMHISDIHSNEVLVNIQKEEIDIDSLRTDLNKSLAVTVNKSFQQIHQLLCFEGIIKIENVHNHVCGTYKFNRIQECYDNITEYINNSTEFTIIFKLRFIKYLLKAYLNMYESDSIFKYDSEKDKYVISESDWKTYQDSEWTSGHDLPHSDMFDELKGKGKKYIQNSFQDTRRAILLSTRGFIQYDNFLCEVGDTITEFIKQDHIHNGSKESFQTKVTKHMFELLKIYSNLDILDIYSKKKIRDPPNIIFHVDLADTTTMELSVEHLYKEMDKEWSKNKEMIFTTITEFKKELDGLIGTTGSSLLDLLSDTNTIMMSTVAVALVISLVLLSKKESKVNNKRDEWEDHRHYYY